MSDNFLPPEARDLKFSSEQQCVDTLFRARWPDGYRCPSCSHSQYYCIQTRKLPLYECCSCSFQTSIIAGTIMEGSRTSLTRWFYAMYLLAQPDGISSRRLSQVIQVTYKTAWLISRKIRHALERSDSIKLLIGNVRIETFNYGYEYYTDARQPLLIGASINLHNQTDQIKIKQPSPVHINNDYRKIKQAGYAEFINKHLHTTGLPIVGKPMKSKPVLTPVKRAVCAWLNETFRGIGPKHLQAYLDEFCFRYNVQLQQNCPFAPLLQHCASTRTATYKQLTRRKSVLPHPWFAFGSKARWKGKHLSAWSY